MNINNREFNQLGYSTQEIENQQQQATSGE
jgi:hypothetical protein